MQSNKTCAPSKQNSETGGKYMQFYAKSMKTHEKHVILCKKSENGEKIPQNTPGQAKLGTRTKKTLGEARGKSPT
jgi:hypothetical protein